MVAGNIILLCQRCEDKGTEFNGTGDAMGQGTVPCPAFVSGQGTVPCPTYSCVGDRGLDSRYA